MQAAPSPCAWSAKITRAHAGGGGTCLWAGNHSPRSPPSILLPHTPALALVAEDLMPWELMIGDGRRFRGVDVASV